MKPKVRKLSIRLLKEDLSPQDAVKDSIELVPFTMPQNTIAPEVEGSDRDVIEETAHAVTGSSEASPPQWVDLLAEADIDTDQITTQSAYGVLLIPARQRWFAITFGWGHTKLKMENFIQNFGLRVVLNKVDPSRLKSIDVRQPSTNTLHKRSQLSKGAEHVAFALEYDRDIVRGVEGVSKDPDFANTLIGTDSLTLRKAMMLQDLPAMCAKALAAYGQDDYKEHFAWIDEFDHVRDEATVAALDNELLQLLHKALKGESTEHVHLALPEVYDPEKVGNFIYDNIPRTKGKYDDNNDFTQHIDLNIANHLQNCVQHGVRFNSVADLSKQLIHQIDSDNNIWPRKLYDLLGCDLRWQNECYVLSGGYWYKIGATLLKRVEQAFNDRVVKLCLPKSKACETEDEYIERIGRKGGRRWLALHRRSMTSPVPRSRIEICDVVTRRKQLIHIKRDLNTQLTSYLFNQGQRSAEIISADAKARSQIGDRVKKVQKATGQSGFTDVIPRGRGFRAADFEIVFAVMRPSERACLPFVSLLDFHRAAKNIGYLGYKCSFAWIDRQPN